MSKFGLRDISERLTRSADTEAVVYELLGYLQAVNTDWRASLAFYELSRDALVRIYERRDRTLLHRDVVIPVDRLPARLVRKFFHPSAFFNGVTRRPLADLLNSAPYYEAEPTDAPGLRDVVPAHDWRSCLCTPLVDREDVLALLVLTSPDKSAFATQVLDEILPLRSLASLALAQHLHRAGNTEHVDDERSSRAAAAEFQDRIRKLNDRNRALEELNNAQQEQIADMTGQVTTLGRAEDELARVKSTVLALEEQTVVATEHLSEAYTQLDRSRSQLEAAQRTVTFVNDLMRAFAEAHERHGVIHLLVERICTRLDAERCSLMLLDEGDATLQIAAQCGMNLALVSQIKVRVGQGVAGWVARHRKALLVQGGEDAPGLPRCRGEAYNSDSFVSVPLVYDERLIGVLNLSNRHDGERFEEEDVDRLQIAAAVIAMLVGREMGARDTRENRAAA